MYHPTPPSLAAPSSASLAHPSTPSSSWRRRAGAGVEEDNGGTQLKEPFEHAAHDYHGTQHDALNAELRGHAERAEEGWAAVIQQACGYVSRVHPRGEAANAALVAALRRYAEGYHCTSQPPLPAASAATLHGLAVPAEEAAAVAEWPVPDEAVVRRSFAQLSNADSILPDDALAAVRAALSPLDGLGGRPVSDCSVAMHERHHSDATAALREELRQGAAYLAAVDRRIDTTRECREEAVTAEDFLRAQGLLQEEVAMGSTVVGLSLQRMGLFDDAAADADAFRRDAADLTDAAAAMQKALMDRAAALADGLAGDVASLAPALEAAEEALRLAEAEAAADVAAHAEAIETLNGEEALVWADVVARMAVLRRIAADRAARTEAALRSVERAGAEKQRRLAELRAGRDYMARLKAALAATDRARGVGEQFAAYAATMTARLAADGDEIDATIDELKIAEATSALVRYGRFAESAEECRQRTRMRREALAMAGREREMALATAGDTLDTDGGRYATEQARAELQVAALDEYLGHLAETTADARTSLEPTLRFSLRALARSEGLAEVGGSDSAPKEPLAIGASPSPALPSADGDAAGAMVADGASLSVSSPPRFLEGSVGLVASGTVRRPAGSSPKRGVASAVGAVETQRVDLSRHPQLAAAIRSLGIEGGSVATAEQFVGDEMAAVEGRRAEMQAAVRRMRDGDGGL